MTRKRIVNVPKLKGWHEVDAALMEIAKAQIEINDIEGQMNTQIIGITEIAKQEAQPYHDKVSILEKDVKAYVEAHKDELDGKTKMLNFGKTGFRLSTKVTLPKGKEAVLQLIKIMKAKKMTDCVKTKETVNKESLKKYKEEELNKLGVGLKKDDTFWYETFQEKLKDVI